MGTALLGNLPLLDLDDTLVLRLAYLDTPPSGGHVGRVSITQKIYDLL